MVPKPTKGATGAKKAGSNSGSRSASVVPGSGVSSGTPVGDVDVVKAEKQEEEEEDAVDDDDDKLYCLCKTRYDENRFMIACDRCVAIHFFQKRTFAY
jgi:COMPASS component SPP1